MRRKDLTGQIYNNSVKVIEYVDSKHGNSCWNVECLHCGAIKYMSLPTIKKSESCGCKRNNHLKNLSKTQRKNLTNKRTENYNKRMIGKVYGDLIVVGRDESPKDRVYWLVRCKCGSEKSMTITRLKTGESCGCDRGSKIDHSGEVYASIKILSFSKMKQGDSFWNIKCLLCGNKKIMRLENIKKAESCGCLKTLKNRERIGSMHKVLVERGCQISANNKKKRSNTSGYIGVGIYYNKRKNIDECKVQLLYQGRRLLNHKYEGNTQGLLKGAIDRDLFIIENELPHRRNFTDEELLENIYLSETKQFSEVIAKTKKDLIEILRNRAND